MKTILYIDESESYRFLLQEELSEEGYRVFTANGIEEALSKFKQEKVKPNFIILELRWSNIKMDVFEKLKNQYPEVPWIGYSTFFQCPDEFKKWIDYYLPKSSKIEEIKVLIKGLF